MTFSPIFRIMTQSLGGRDEGGDWWVSLMWSRPRRIQGSRPRGAALGLLAEIPVKTQKPFSSIIDVSSHDFLGLLLDLALERIDEILVVL